MLAVNSTLPGGENEDCPGYHCWYCCDATAESQDPREALANRRKSSRQVIKPKEVKVLRKLAIVIVALTATIIAAKTYQAIKQANPQD